MASGRSSTFMSPCQVDLDVGVVAPGAGRHVLEDLGEVGRDRLLVALAAGEGEIALDHALHVGDVVVSSLVSGEFGQQRQRQLHAGQRRPQVVADAGQHLGALLDRAAQPDAHGVEGGGGVAHLARAAGEGEVGHVAALAQRVGGDAEMLDRHQLAAHEPDGEAEQHQAEADLGQT